MPRVKLGAVILAGGQASRLNFVDKPLLCVNGKEIITYVIDKAGLDSSKIVISVNRNPERFEKFNLPLVKDLIKDKPDQAVGPLLGIYSAMAWFRKQDPEIKYLACYPADVPFFPAHIGARLLAILQHEQSKIAWCICNGQIQPLFSVWSLEVFTALEEAIENGIYGPKLFIPHHPNSLITINDGAAGDFFNINTHAELEQAEKLATNYQLASQQRS